MKLMYLWLRKLLALEKKFRMRLQKEYEKCRALKELREHLPGGKIPSTLSREEKAEIRAFWGKRGKHMRLDWHELLYERTGNRTPAFESAPIFSLWLKDRMNRLHFARVWSDKSYLDFFLRDIPTARSVVRNVNGRFLDENFELIDFARAESLMNEHEALVAKPSINGGQGLGVQLLRAPFDLKQIDEKYKRDYVLQIPIRQHPGMAKLNESSVNAIRMNTVLFDTEAHMMSAFVKVGEEGKFADNEGKNRYFIGITEDGCFAQYAIDHDLNKYDHIPSGFAFAGQKVPFFEEACRTVEKAHCRLAHFGFAYWDVCIAENGEPTIVEVNLKRPSTLIPQIATGKPFLGEYLDPVREYIRRKC